MIEHPLLVETFANVLSVAKVPLLATVMGTTIGVVIDGSTHVPLAVVLAVASTCIATAFWLGARLTRWEDRLRRIEERLETLPCDRNSRRCDDTSLID